MAIGSEGLPAQSVTLDPASDEPRPGKASPPWSNWPAVGRKQRLLLGFIAAVLLLTVALELADWLAPGLLERAADAAGLQYLHPFLHLLQAGTSTLLFVAAVTWLLRSDRTIVQASERASTIEGAIESLSAGVAIFDRQDRLVACNEAYRALYPEVADLLRPGTSHAQLLRAYFPVAPDTLVEGRSIDQFIGESLRRREPDTTFTDRVRCLHDKWVMMNDCRTADGGMICLRTVVSEEELRTLAVSRQRRAMDDLADLTHDWFWRLDKDGLLVECSQALAKALGRTRR